jgi:hypothetical protein
MYRDFKYGKNGLFPFRESRNGTLFGNENAKKNTALLGAEMIERRVRTGSGTAGFTSCGTEAESFCRLHFYAFSATLPKPFYSTIDE